jgi:hypothetical protein
MHVGALRHVLTGAAETPRMSNKREDGTQPRPETGPAHFWKRMKSRDRESLMKRSESPLAAARIRKLILEEAL